MTPQVRMEKTIGINGEWLSDRDTHRFAWAVRRVREILHVPPMADYIHSELVPNLDKDDELHAWVGLYLCL